MLRIDGTGAILWANDVGGHSAMILNGRLRWRLLGGLLAAVLFDTLLQITWKSAVLEAPSDPSPIAVMSSVLSNPALIGIIAIMALQFFNWLMVLGEADLSYAKPVASLSYACVPIVSVLMLNEAIDGFEIAGVVFVIAGVWFISQTKPMTEDTTTLP
jgi:drug/metabolite transporter (DMT)-like permease